jgi:hypothetical protein
MSQPGAPEALRRAIARRDPNSDTYHGDQEVAFLRLLVAHRSKSGVRLTKEEVQGLFCDHATATAAENMEADLLYPEESP